MEFSIMTTTDKLIRLITAKRDMKEALKEKGVETWGGLNIYPEAIDRIPAVELRDGLIVRDGVTLAFSTINGLTIYTDGVNDMSYMFYGCTIVNLNQLDTSDAIDMSYMFANTSIDSIPSIDCRNVKNVASMLYSTHPTNIGGFIGLKISLDCRYPIIYEYDKSKYINIVDNLYDWTANPDNLIQSEWDESPRITVNSKFIDFLSIEDKKMLTDKGWTLYST